MGILLRFILALTTLLAGSMAAHASSFGLEAGVMPAFYFPVGSLANENFYGIGINGAASYETGHWGFGARILGTISNHADLHIAAQSYDIIGELARRQYGIEALSRYFFDQNVERRRWYM